MKSDQMEKMLTGPIFLILLAGTGTPALVENRLIFGMDGGGLSYGSTFFGSDESDLGFIPLSNLKSGITAF